MKLFRTYYPDSTSKREILLSSFAVAVIAYIFLVVFQPFGTYTFSHRLKYFLLVPYALITFLAFATTNLSLRGRTKNWNLLKEALKLVAILSLTAVFSYWYNVRFINHDRFTASGLLYMWYYTLAVGIPVCIMYVLARYIYLRNSAFRINDDVVISAVLTESKPLVIRAAPGSEVLELRENDFLFAASEGNYCLVYYRENGGVRKQLLRLSLKMLEEQLTADRIIRCHRSYIVNTDRITHVKGNAQGYKLSVQDMEVVVPVSRSYIEAIRRFVKTG